MNKKTTIILAFAMLGLSKVHAQNVGVGIATPTAKLHVNQTAAVDAILVNHAGATGNALELIPSNPANTNAVLFIQNGSSGAGVNSQMLNTTSSASSILSTNQGLGIGLDIFQASAGASNAAMRLINNGTGVLSRGADVYLGANNNSIGYTLFHSGTGRGMYTDLNNTANPSIGYDLRHAGTGRGMYVHLSGTNNGATGSALYHDGLGRASYMTLSNPSNSSTGLALYHSGTGMASEFGILSTTNASMAQSLFHEGLGRGQQIVLRNAANTQQALTVIHEGNGIGQYISVTNPLASRNSTALVVNYNGTVGGVGGAGNAVEIQHYGNNGTAAEVFMGNPAFAAGPANSTSEYPALAVRHMATGTSPTVGIIKSAITAANNSADPTILVNNNGTEDGGGIQVFVTPVVTANQATGIYAQSAPSIGGGAGIGVSGFGGDFGVIGGTNGGNNLGLFSSSDFAANGTKAFLIDHPLDPANKTLRHFCIESDEVLNMYRGMIELGTNGQAVIELPDYFDAININPSYQLTAIGTATQPYVLSEISNNQFVIAGAPNTKVSWTVHAQRNDPTIQYYKATIDNYTTNVRMKRPDEVGKYFMPEAYGKSKEQGMFYNAARAKNYEEREAMAKEQQAVSPTKFSPVLEQKGSLEKQEEQKPVMGSLEQTTEETVSKR
ncbi:MAG: Unknown protein [uncultured Aureispira sp.]|uniref:Uncharacterized protein n=1 Tax=uncultured Aureispira sp. TaxID=1331704 RepID=A0A6S6UNR3_9BACT|nr:MAG: Unknown protein [uncultured Aureispira sp.]